LDFLFFLGAFDKLCLAAKLCLVALLKMTVSWGISRVAIEYHLIMNTSGALEAFFGHRDGEDGEDI
jgi:hypothetical protein